MPTGEFKELSQYVTDDIIEALSICRTVDEVIGKIEEYIKTGVIHLIPVNIG